MAQFSAVQKQQIARLARKEAKAENAGFKNTLSDQRRTITELKRRMAVLERQLKNHGAGTTPLDQPPEAAKARFSADWVRRDRRRLELTREEYSALVGVNSITIYRWENGYSKPRRKPLAAWAAVRQMDQPEALKRLKKLGM